jgi:tetratricopeptide (TPR) repeat protein
LHDPPTPLPIVRRAHHRCRSHGRLHLALAIVTDQRWPTGTTVRLPGQRDVFAPSGGHRDEVIRLYATASRFPETAVEARVRAAWFALRVGELDRALQLIQAAEEPAADPQLDYLRLLVRGQIHQARGETRSATEAFQYALGAWPRAQSARVSLLVLEAGHGSRFIAESLAESIQTASADDFDPWWRYWQGEYRHFTRDLASIRAMVR